MKKVIVKKAANPALIVFGEIDGKPHAGTFSNADSALAKKAATKLGLSVLIANEQTARDFANKLPAGSVHANASGFVPLARKAVYDLLTNMIRADAQLNNEGRQQKAEANASPVSKHQNSPPPRRPIHWDDISVGDLVLSQDSDPHDGWWTAIVVKRKGDMCTLRWQKRSDRRTFKRHKFNLALLWPGEDFAEVRNEARGRKTSYPINWGAIEFNHFVLAQEDGPIQQFWNSKIIEASGQDQFKLRWDGYLDVPEIERHRHSLALIHPNPGNSIRRSKAS